LGEGGVTVTGKNTPALSFVCASFSAAAEAIFGAVG